MYPLSVQLYTIRDDITKNLKQSFKRLADTGFKHVETAFLPEGISMQYAADILKELGLNVCSCHGEIPTKDSIAFILTTAQTYDCQTTIWHGWPEDKRYGTLEGTRALIKMYNEGNKIAKDNGLRFGLHNHWWEYKHKVGGKLIYEVLDEELDEDVFFETDVYWVKVAGQDPGSMIQRLKHRIRLLHIKDGPAIYTDNLPLGDPEAMTPVGQGNLDIPAIVNACTADVEWLVVELDKSTIEVYEALKQSFEYLSELKQDVKK